VAPASIPDRAQKLALCHQAIASVAETTLTRAETTALDNLCDIAASGDDARVRAAEREICLTVLRESSGLPAAAAAAEEQSCNQATQGLSG
jgi:hypothetical protein